MKTLDKSQSRQKQEQEQEQEREREQEQGMMFDSEDITQENYFQTKKQQERRDRKGWWERLKQPKRES